MASTVGSKRVLIILKTFPTILTSIEDHPRIIVKGRPAKGTVRFVWKLASCLLITSNLWPLRIRIASLSKN